jgi:hypothetical protein
MGGSGIEQDGPLVAINTYHGIVPYNMSSKDVRLLDVNTVNSNWSVHKREVGCMDVNLVLLFGFARYNDILGIRENTMEPVVFRQWHWSGTDNTYCLANGCKQMHSAFHAMCVMKGLSASTICICERASWYKDTMMEEIYLVQLSLFLRFCCILANQRSNKNYFISNYSSTLFYKFFDLYCLYCIGPCIHCLT